MASEERKAMGHILRLRNLPWDGSTLDIRHYFSGLSIPARGVEIVGGNEGNAFITFSTDEDARQAMERSGGEIKGNIVSITLSSQCEVMTVRKRAMKENELLRQCATSEIFQQNFLKRPYDHLQLCSRLQNISKQENLNPNEKICSKMPKTSTDSYIPELRSSEEEVSFLSRIRNQKNGNGVWNSKEEFPASDQGGMIRNSPIVKTITLTPKPAPEPYDPRAFTKQCSQSSYGVKDQISFSDFQKAGQTANDSTSIPINFQESGLTNLSPMQVRMFTQQPPPPPPPYFGASPQIGFRCPPPSTMLKPPFNPMFFTFPTPRSSPSLFSWQLQNPAVIQMKSPHPPPLHTQSYSYRFNPFNKDNPNIPLNSVATKCCLDVKSSELQGFKQPENNELNHDGSYHYNQQDQQRRTYNISGKKNCSLPTTSDVLFRQPVPQNQLFNQNFSYLDQCPARGIDLRRSSKKHKSCSELNIPGYPSMNFQYSKGDKWKR